jgi:hypothetical protein
VRTLGQAEGTPGRFAVRGRGPGQVAGLLEHVCSCGEQPMMAGHPLVGLQRR